MSSVLAGAVYAMVKMAGALVDYLEEKSYT